MMTCLEDYQSDSDASRMFPNPKFWQIPLMSADDLNRQVGFKYSSHDSKALVILVQRANHRYQKIAAKSRSDSEIMHVHRFRAAGIYRAPVEGVRDLPDLVVGE